MDAKELSDKMKSVPLVFDGELPKNLQYLRIDGNLIEYTKEHRQELIKILEKHDAIGDKLTKLYKDWRKKYGRIVG